MFCECLHTGASARALAHTHSLTHARTHTHTHTHTHMHARTHAHTHPPPPPTHTHRLFIRGWFEPKLCRDDKGCRLTPQTETLCCILLSSLGHQYPLPYFAPPPPPPQKKKKKKKKKKKDLCFSTKTLNQSLFH